MITQNVKYRLEDVQQIDFECTKLKGILGLLAVAVFEKMTGEGVTDNKRRSLLDGFVMLGIHIVNTVSSSPDDLRKLKMFYKNLEHVSEMNLEINKESDAPVLAKAVAFTPSGVTETVDDDCIGCPPSPVAIIEEKRHTMPVKIIQKEMVEKDIFGN